MEATTALPHDLIGGIGSGEESELLGRAAVDGVTAARLKAPGQAVGAADGRGRGHARVARRWRAMMTAAALAAACRAQFKAAPGYER